MENSNRNKFDKLVRYAKNVDYCIHGASKSFKSDLLMNNGKVHKGKLNIFINELDEIIKDFYKDLGLPYTKTIKSFYYYFLKTCVYYIVETCPSFDWRYSSILKISKTIFKDQGQSIFEIMVESTKNNQGEFSLELNESIEKMYICYETAYTIIFEFFIEKALFQYLELHGLSSLFDDEIMEECDNRLQRTSIFLESLIK